VQQIVKEEPDRTIPEVAEEFWRRSGTKVSCSAMGRTLRRLGSPEINSLIARRQGGVIVVEHLTATEQAEPRIQELRRRFIELAKKLDPRRLVFIDEAGSHIAMTREYARAPRGERAVGSVPRNAGTVTTMIGAFDLTGVRAMMTIEGATDGEVFETFLERVLLRKLRPGDIVVLDNVGATERRTSGGSSRRRAQESFTCRPTRRT
jgi:hypothetical protein